MTDNNKSTSGYNDNQSDNEVDQIDILGYFYFILKHIIIVNLKKE